MAPTSPFPIFKHLELFLVKFETFLVNQQDTGTVSNFKQWKKNPLIFEVLFLFFSFDGGEIAGLPSPPVECVGIS